MLMYDDYGVIDLGEEKNVMAVYLQPSCAARGGGINTFAMERRSHDCKG